MSSSSITYFFDDQKGYTDIFFPAPAHCESSSLQYIVSGIDKPVTYALVHQGVKNVFVDASNGSIIIVLPKILEKNTLLIFERTDSNSDHEVQIKAQKGQINGRDKINLAPADPQRMEIFRTVNLSKTGQYDWSILLK